MNKRTPDKRVTPVRPSAPKPSGTRKARPQNSALGPGSIVDIRSHLGLCLVGFARAFGISVDTLQNWEQGRRQPTGPAKVLLKIAARDPAGMLKSVA